MGIELKSLDLSHNTKLTNLECVECGLETLDLSFNSELTRLICNKNQLKSLVLGQNPKLESIDCTYNYITELNLLGCVGLKNLYCDRNGITNLDLKSNKALVDLRCSCMKLSQLNLSNNVNLQLLDCGYNALESLDIINNVKLNSLYCDANGLKSLYLEKNVNLVTLDCASNNLASLDISKNVNLRNLDCRYNTYLEELDICNNPHIVELYNSSSKTPNSDGSVICQTYFENGGINRYFRYSDTTQINSIENTYYETSGIISQGNGWKLKWVCKYRKDKDDNPLFPELSIIMEGVDANNQYKYTVSDQDDFSPWLTEMGIDKEAFRKITLKGTAKNPLDIARNQFSGYTNVTTVECNYVHCFGESAFEGCTSLQNILYFDASLEAIEAKAFKNCTSLLCVQPRIITDEDKILLKNLRAIGDEAFSGTSLLEIALTPETKNIGVNAFYGCRNLTIYCFLDSAAYEYAILNDISYELIGEWSYPINYFGKTTYFSSQDLEQNSFKYNKTIAELSSLLAYAVYNNEGRDAENIIQQQMGLRGKYTYWSDNGFCYTLGADSVYLDNKKTNVIVIDCRGTDSWTEKLGDRFTVCNHNINGYPLYGIVYDFAEKVKFGLTHLEIDGQPLELEADTDSVGDYTKWKISVNNGCPTKILVVGHSLGGATANYIGALINNSAEFSDQYDKGDIFVYTFGPLDSIYVPAWGKSVSEGYENIHNIYNFYDSYGPNGWNVLTANGNSGRGKFGHIDIFALCIDPLNPWVWGLDHNKNHMLPDAYIPATFADGFIDHDTDRRVVSMHCPVDVNVYKKGELVASVVNNVANDTLSGIPVMVDNDEKYFLIDTESEYTFEIIATGEGTLEYDVLDVSGDDNSKVYVEVKLEPGKTMTSTITPETKTEEVQLHVVDEKGEVIAEIQEDGKEVPVNENPKVQDIFKDINEGDWFIPYVQYAYDNNLMSGKGENFAPNDPLRREEFTQILYSHSGKPETDFENPFADVKKDWYTNSVLWAKQNGIADGKTKNGKNVFGVGQNITREELALMIYKYAKLKNYDLERTEGATEGFSDSNKVSSWSKEALEWAITQGILGGKGKSGAPKSELKIDPQGKASRAECACMIANLLQKNE